MFLARSGVVAATLLVLQSTLSIAAPLSENVIHNLEKRISCHTNGVVKDNACVSCASLYTNATTCTRSVPLTCSYGEVSGRKCVAVDCTKTPGTYLSTDGKECLACFDKNALTCNRTTTLSCKPNFTLFDKFCFNGLPYAEFWGYGLAKPFLAKQQPFKPFLAQDSDYTDCVRRQLKAKVIYYTGDSSNTCVGQNGPLDQNVVMGARDSQTVIIKGFCSDYDKSPFVTANKAPCVQAFIPP